MPDSLSPDEFLDLHPDQPIIDVRSPGEYQNGHIARAVNLPLFDDAERAEVGTIYKQKGRDHAVIRGLEIVGPKMAGFVVSAKKISRAHRKLNELQPLAEDGDDRPPIPIGVHCWRGGMRSESFAWLLEKGGLAPSLLNGGYKSYRNHVQSRIDRQFNLLVISGLTGAGKTKYLHLLKSQGQQVVDLEGLANHRGSAFGAIGLGDQPSTEHFENLLFYELEKLDSSMPIWVEDEGNRIGGVVVPPSFHKQMQHADAIFVDASVSRRVEHLIEVYGPLPKEALAHSVEKIRKRLGGQHVNDALAALETGDLKKTTEIVLAYYDKTYLKAVDSMPRTNTHNLPVGDLSDDKVVDRLIEMAQQVATS